MMIKNTILLCSLLFTLLACQAETTSTATETPVWQLSQTSAKGLFKLSLMCRHAPSVGPFQDCQVELQDQQGQVVNDAKLSVDGGMPSHGHGLPTAPVISSLDDQGHYRIDGLQYNMPGAWLLGFVIKTASSQDKVVFSFEISTVEQAACAQPSHLPAS
ncbi:MAG: FixH family protein [Thiolinea sp.]